MGRAIQCDRCGEFQTEMGAEWRGYNTATPDGYHNFILCDDCREKFVEFMDGRELESRIGTMGYNATVTLEVSDFDMELVNGLTDDEDDFPLDEIHEWGHRNY